MAFTYDFHRYHSDDSMARDVTNQPSVWGEEEHTREGGGGGGEALSPRRH